MKVAPISLQLNLSKYVAASLDSVLIDRGIVRQGEQLDAVFDRVVGALLTADAQLDHAKKIDEALLTAVATFVERQSIVFGTPLLTALGRPGEVPVASSVLAVPVRNGTVLWDELLPRVTTYLYAGIGVGFDLTAVADPVAALIKLNAHVRQLNGSLRAAQRRPVACMATLHAKHPKVLEFIQAKVQQDFLQWHFNISIWVTAAMFDPNKRTAEDEVLLDAIATAAQACGEPGILFHDRFEAGNATPHLPYLSVVPCGEAGMGAGENCQLSYINVATLTTVKGKQRVFDEAALQQVVRTVTRLMDAVVELTQVNPDLGLQPVLAQRRLGIGVTGFAALLRTIGLKYSSAQAVELAARIAEVAQYASRSESVELAQKRGPFPLFTQSRFLDAAWLKQKHARATVISEREWLALDEAILQSGVRNATTTAHAPSGTSSLIVGTTQQWEPVLAAANKIPTEQHVKVIAAVQRFTDEAISKTVNLPKSATVADVRDLFQVVYQLQLKGITVFP